MFVCDGVCMCCWLIAARLAFYDTLKQFGDALFEAEEIVEYPVTAVDTDATIRHLQVFENSPFALCILFFFFSN